MRRPGLSRLVLIATTAAIAAACAPPAGDDISQAAGSAESFKVAFIAYQNPDQLLESVAPVAEYLESEMGRPIEAFAATDYAGIIEALKTGAADAGFMGPLQYVIANQEAGARPILGELYNGSPSYVSHIFVRRDSGISSLEELEQKSVAFVDPLSSSGYMFPLDTFLQAGLIESVQSAEDFFRKIYFAGGDEQAIRAVLNRFVDAAGVGQYSVRLLRPEEREQLVTLAASRPIPSHCVVVRDGLEAQVTADFQQALLALNEGDNHDLLQNLYAVDGYVVADHGTYQGVEDMARQYGFLGASE